jgi:hypothetical protein
MHSYYKNNSHLTKSQYKRNEVSSLEEKWLLLAYRCINKQSRTEAVRIIKNKTRLY